MKNAVLIATILAVFIIGFFIILKFGGFLDEVGRANKSTGQNESETIVILPKTDKDEIMRQISEFSLSHDEFSVVLTTKNVKSEMDLLN